VEPGELVGGAAGVGHASSSGCARVAAPGVTIIDPSGTVIANDDSSSWGLRVWDAESEGIRRFGSIDSFEHDPAWVVTADFVPTEAGAEVDIRTRRTST
jgi:uncharacterized protein (DUF1684 family)